MGFAGLICLASVVGAANASGRGKNGLALVALSPVMLIGALMVGGIVYGDWKAEASPDVLYREVFGMPPVNVSNLCGYKNDDELSPIYLQFNAPPQVVTKLTGTGWVPFGAAPQNWKFLPSWFDTSASPSTKFYSLKSRMHNTGDYVMMVDRPTNRVRVYFSSPASAAN